MSLNFGVFVLAEEVSEDEQSEEDFAEEQENGNHMPPGQPPDRNVVEMIFIRYFSHATGHHIFLGLLYFVPDILHFNFVHQPS